MSSLEIAELTGKEHKHVLRDIRVMLEMIGAADQFWATALVPGPNGSTRSIPVAHLPFDETMTLVAGYDAVLRFKIVKRWRELEQAKPALPHVDSLSSPWTII